MRRFGPALVLGPGTVLATVLVFTFGCPSTRTPCPQKPGRGALVTIPDDAPVNASSCEDRLAFAREAMNELVESAGGNCTVDAQCTTVFAETPCFGACQSPILLSRVDAFHEAQLAISERVCVGYMQDGCAYSGPRCRQMEAFCDQGRCALMEPEE